MNKLVNNKMRECITSVKKVCEFFEVDMPIIHFSKEVHSGRIAEYDNLKEQIVLFNNCLAPSVAAHEAIHHVQYQMDMERANDEAWHGSQYQYLYNKAKKAGIKVVSARGRVYDA